MGAALMLAATVCSSVAPKYIGIFAIAVPVIGLVMSVITRLVIGVENVEISIDMAGIFMGVIVLGLTQFFVHGATLAAICEVLECEAGDILEFQKED